MSSIFKILSIFLTLTFVSCSSDENQDDCMKTITIPQYYIVGNQYYNYNTEQEVPCDFPEPNEPALIEPLQLEQFSYDVIQFEYIPDTGNNTALLQFEIKLNNNSSQPVEGTHYLTINIDGIQTSTTYGINTCQFIEANSSCTISFETEDSHNLGTANSIELIDVKYYLISN